MYLVCYMSTWTIFFYCDESGNANISVWHPFIHVGCSIPLTCQYLVVCHEWFCCFREFRSDLRFGIYGTCSILTYMFLLPDVLSLPQCPCFPINWIIIEFDGCFFMYSNHTLQSLTLFGVTDLIQLAEEQLVFKMKLAKIRRENNSLSSICRD